MRRERTEPRRHRDAVDESGSWRPSRRAGSGMPGRRGRKTVSSWEPGLRTVAHSRQSMRAVGCRGRSHDGRRIGSKFFMPYTNRNAMVDPQQHTGYYINDNTHCKLLASLTLSPTGRVVPFDGVGGHRNSPSRQRFPSPWWRSSGRSADDLHFLHEVPPISRISTSIQNAGQGSMNACSTTAPGISRLATS